MFLSSFLLALLLDFDFQQMNKWEQLNLLKNPEAKRSKVLLDVLVNKPVVFDPERVEKVDDVQSIQGSTAKSRGPGLGMLTPPLPLESSFMLVDFSNLCDCTTTQLQAFCSFQTSKIDERRISLLSGCSVDAKGHGIIFLIYHRYRCKTSKKNHILTDV